jgi:hypothetical protein
LDTSTPPLATVVLTEASPFELPAQLSLQGCLERIHGAVDGVGCLPLPLKLGARTFFAVSLLRSERRQ